MWIDFFVPAVQHWIAWLEDQNTECSNAWVNSRVVVCLVHPLSVPACSEILTLIYTRATGKSNGINLIVPTQGKIYEYKPIIYDLPQ